MARYKFMKTYEIQEIKRICSKYSSIKKAVLFGSRARGDNNDRSDYDVAIYFDNKPEHQILTNIDTDIDEIETLLKIDTTIINDSLEPAFLENIKNEGIVIYVNKLQNKYQNLCKAVKRLEEIVCKIEKSMFDDYIMNEIMRDSLIQRFEFTYELAWKTLKEYLSYQGYAGETSPRSVFKAAYQNSIIGNQEIWLSMVKDRNVASHEYNDSYIDEVASRIKSSYFQEFLSLTEKIKSELNT